MTNSHPDYDNLPEAIKQQVTPKEHMWIGPLQRAKLMEDFCLPEASDD